MKKSSLVVGYMYKNPTYVCPNLEITRDMYEAMLFFSFKPFIIGRSELSLARTGTPPLMLANAMSADGKLL